jgi:hypothetical protein
VSLIKVRISEHKKAEDEKAEALREKIRKEELQKIEDDKAKQVVVEPIAEPAPVVTPVQIKTSPIAQAAPKPTPAPAQQASSLQAEVFDLESLVKAVAYGQAPISVLSVNWEALDAMVADQGSNFSMAGVKLVKVAA